MSEIFQTLLSDYGMQIIGAALTAIAGALGFMIKKLVTKFLNDKTKKEVAEIVVQGIEQIYQTLSGPEKLEKAIETATEMLNEKGITCTELELRMLLESALGKFKDVFNKTDSKTSSEDWVAAELPQCGNNIEQ